MSNAVATTRSSALGAALGELAKFVPSTLPFAKFNANVGKFTYGKDQNEIPAGSEVAVNDQLLKMAWVCWSDGNVVDQLVADVTKGEVLPPESELTAHPKVDDDDGWRKQISVGFRLIDIDGAPEVEFVAQTYSALRAVTKLMTEYQSELKQRGEDAVMIVKLGSEDFMPKEKKYGKKYAPTFEIMEWTTTQKLVETFGESSSDNPDNYVKEETKALPAPTPEPVKAAEPEPVKAAEPEPVKAADPPPATGGRRKRF